MYIYTLCFSPKDARSNYYLYCLMLMVHTMRKVGTFDPTKDKFFVLCDDATGALINQMPCFREVETCPVGSPKTTFDMMKYKYLFPKYIDCSDQVVLYLDTDFLAIQRLAFDIPADNFLIFPEGQPTDSNYCPPGAKLSVPFGATAGIFGYRFGPKVQETFQYILQRMEAEPQRFYALDQPHFNMAYPHAPFKIVPVGSVSFNGHGPLQKAVLINLAGEPGDGPFHFGKMLQMFLQLGHVWQNSHSHPAPAPKS